MTGAATELRVALGDGYLLRSVTPDDAPALAAAYLRNRAHLAPWEPVRGDGFFAVDEQARRLHSRVASDARGESITAVVVDGADAVVASVNVNDIVRAVFGNGHLGYWTDGEHTGRGLMTRAVAAVCDHARAEGLHRLQAATLLHNAGSQQVLRRNGFSAIGVAPDYLFIAGAWQDHVLFQRILSDADPV
ncbi:GNAT family N-acetyltransferase [Mumia sp. zg.B17]|uniref:GNAT family N-acetyltransferase n=1 Tax=unclassified Mumia TaxID=2621872 RepID=UPI001C6E9EC5|nr:MULTISPECIES: GNAT family protein [unclassified Mumia]MBW9204412.1 GNAT family N-acetyltransferase [Mumia sp. zg.B17]MBW9209602.1 GNAT family N-acetyltransferase [Mumia sp. zg.B21]MDD9349490.1 GNAT family protein [Mumia sp.]